MNAHYIKVYTDDDGEVVDQQPADGFVRHLHNQVAVLQQALEIERRLAADLRELLASVRKIAHDLNDELKDS